MAEPLLDSRNCCTRCGTRTVTVDTSTTTRMLLCGCWVYWLQQSREKYERAKQEAADASTKAKGE